MPTPPSAPTTSPARCLRQCQRILRIRGVSFGRFNSNVSAYPPFPLCFSHATLESELPLAPLAHWLSRPLLQAGMGHLRLYKVILSLTWIQNRSRLPRTAGLVLTNFRRLLLRRRRRRRWPHLRDRSPLQLHLWPGFTPSPAGRPTSARALGVELCATVSAAPGTCSSTRVKREVNWRMPLSQRLERLRNLGRRKDGL